MKISLDAALSATGATLVDALDAPQFVRVSTDTRTIQPGDTFLALRGDRFDGHTYTAEAVARGAAMLVLDETNTGVPGTPAMMVRDTLHAYMALARTSRDRFSGRVVAITGSAGKTTTKFFLAQLLAAQYGERVLVAPANENNEIGVSKLLLEASNERHDVVVVEMGARKPGDIAALVAIAQPELGILTNVGDAHIEIMGSRAELAATKWALFGAGARPILNAQDAVSIVRGRSLSSPPHWFCASELPFDYAASPGAGRLTALIGDSTLLDLRDDVEDRLPVHVRVPGLHNRANLAAAIAGAIDLGVPLEVLLPAIGAVRLPEGRYESIELPGALRIIYDAYNANASGMIAALDAFADETAARRIAVLGSMAELGDESEALHERVGEHAAATNVDVLLVGGDYAAALARGAQNAGLPGERIVHVETNADAAQWLREHGRSDDVVLLKASRRYRLEEIVEALRS